MKIISFFSIASLLVLLQSTDALFNYAKFYGTPTHSLGGVWYAGEQQSFAVCWTKEAPSDASKVKAHLTDVGFTQAIFFMGRGENGNIKKLTPRSYQPVQSKAAADLEKHEEARAKSGESDNSDDTIPPIAGGDADPITRYSRDNIDRQAKEDQEPDSAEMMRRLNDLRKRSLNPFHRSRDGGSLAAIPQEYIQSGKCYLIQFTPNKNLRPGCDYKLKVYGSKSEKICIVKSPKNDAQSAATHYPQPFIGNDDSDDVVGGDDQQNGGYFDRIKQGTKSHYDYLKAGANHHIQNIKDKFNRE